MGGQVGSGKSSRAGNQEPVGVLLAPQPGSCTSELAGWYVRVVVSGEAGEKRADCGSARRERSAGTWCGSMHVWRGGHQSNYEGFTGCCHQRNWGCTAHRFGAITRPAAVQQGSSVRHAGAPAAAAVHSMHAAAVAQHVRAARVPAQQRPLDATRSWPQCDMCTNKQAAQGPTLPAAPQPPPHLRLMRRRLLAKATGACGPLEWCASERDTNSRASWMGLKPLTCGEDERWVGGV